MLAHPPNPADGFRAGQYGVGLLTAAAAVAGAGPEIAAAGALGVIGLGAAKAATEMGLEFGRGLTQAAVGTTDQLLENVYGAPTGNRHRP